MSSVVLPGAAVRLLAQPGAAAAAAAVIARVDLPHPAMAMAEDAAEAAPELLLEKFGAHRPDGRAAGESRQSEEREDQHQAEHVIPHGAAAGVVPIRRTSPTRMLLPQGRSRQSLFSAVVRFDTKAAGHEGDEVLRRLICAIGRHHRLGRAVTWDGYDFRSVCRFCGRPMYKHGNVRWRPVPRTREKTLLLTYRPAEAPPWPKEWSN